MYIDLTKEQHRLCEIMMIKYVTMVVQEYLKRILRYRKFQFPVNYILSCQPNRYLFDIRTIGNIDLQSMLQRVGKYYVRHFKHDRIMKFLKFAITAYLAISSQLYTYLADDVERDIRMIF